MLQYTTAHDSILLFYMQDSSKVTLYARLKSSFTIHFTLLPAIRMKISQFVSLQRCSSNECKNLAAGLVDSLPVTFLAWSSGFILRTPIWLFAQRKGMNFVSRKCFFLLGLMGFSGLFDNIKGLFPPAQTPFNHEAN